MPRPKRRSPRLEAYDYATEGAYFVTVCSRGGRGNFGEVVDDVVQLHQAGRMVEWCWLDLPSHHAGVELDVFVVMPNHLHGIVWLTRAGQAPPLQTLIGSFKASVSRRLGRPLWQRGFHDRVIRDGEELQALRRYLVNNPLKWAIDREHPNHV